MSVIKQISVFNGSSWDTDSIGANAGNIDLLSADGTTASTVAGSTNLLTGLTNILPSSQLTASRALVSDGNGKISVSSVTSTQLGYLSGTTSNIQTQINTLDTNLNTIWGNFNYHVLASNSYKATSTAYQNVNCNLTVPVGYVAIARYNAEYASGAPLGMAVTINSTASPTAGNMIYKQEVTSNTEAHGYTPLLVLTAGTYRFWVKRGTVPGSANSHQIEGFMMVRTY